MNYSESASLEDETIKEKGTILELFKYLFSLRNVCSFVIAYMISKLQFTEDIMPFSFAILAAMNLYNIPIVIPVVASTLGIISSSVTGFAIYEYLAAAILFLIISSFIKIDGINKKVSIGMKMIFSVLIIDVLKVLTSETMLLTGIKSAYELVAIALFYILFASAMFVFININKPAIFADEEIIAFAIMIGIASLTFAQIEVLTLSIVNLVGIMMVLIVGYKNGAISGCVTGAVLGLLYSIVVKNPESSIAVYAFSGLIAGILNRFGKIGVIIGFVIGNMAISYFLTGKTELMQGMNEILVSAIVLLLVPKKLELKMESIFNKKILLDAAYGNYLADSQDAKSKLEAISNVFSDLSNNISTIKMDQDAKDDAKEVVYNFLKTYKEKNCLGCKNYKTCMSEDKIKLSSDYIVETIENKNMLKENAISVECNKSPEIRSEINSIYNNIRLAYLLKQKELENANRVSKQYKEVSKMIGKMAENLIQNKRKSSDLKMEEAIKQELKLFGYNIYDGEYVVENGKIEYTLITDLLTNIDKQKEEIQNIVSSTIDKNMQINLILNSSKTEKAKIKLISDKNITIDYAVCNISKEEVSGDNYLVSRISEDKYLVALADGEGTGKDASEASKKALSTIEKLIVTGFSKENALETINSILKLSGKNARFSTIDLSIIDTKNIEIEFIKYGAAPTFIVSNKKVSIINADSLPMGVAEHVTYVPNSRKVNPGDIIIMLSDGVIAETSRDENIKKFISKIKSYADMSNLEKISKELSDFAKEEINARDDITVLMTKIV